MRKTRGTESALHSSCSLAPSLFKLTFRLVFLFSRPVLPNLPNSWLRSRLNIKHTHARRPSCFGGHCDLTRNLYNDGEEVVNADGILFVKLCLLPKDKLLVHLNPSHAMELTSAARDQNSWNT